MPRHSWRQNTVSILGLSCKKPSAGKLEEKNLSRRKLLFGPVVASVSSLCSAVNGSYKGPKQHFHIASGPTKDGPAAASCS